jgi:hypothetical protein
VFVWKTTMNSQDQREINGMINEKAQDFIDIYTSYYLKINSLSLLDGATA